MNITFYIALVLLYYTRSRTARVKRKSSLHLVPLRHAGCLYKYKYVISKYNSSFMKANSFIILHKIQVFVKTSIFY